VPALAQAARATCRLSKGAAIPRWSFLTNFLRGGPFCYFISAGGLICQKFRVFGPRPDDGCRGTYHLPLGGHVRLSATATGLTRLDPCMSASASARVYVESAMTY
jgi:hypothetical protein